MRPPIGIVFNIFVSCLVAAVVTDGFLLRTQAQYPLGRSKSMACKNSFCPATAAEPRQRNDNVPWPTLEAKPCKLQLLDTGEIFRSRLGRPESCSGRRRASMQSLTPIFAENMERSQGKYLPLSSISRLPRHTVPSPMRAQHAKLNPHQLRFAAGEKEPPGFDASATWNSLLATIFDAGLFQQGYRFGAHERFTSRMFIQTSEFFRYAHRHLEHVRTPHLARAV